MATGRRQKRAGTPRRRGAPLLVKAIVYLLILGNLGLLSWFAYKKYQARQGEPDAAGHEGPGDELADGGGSSPTTEPGPRLGVSAKALDFGEVSATSGTRLAVKVGNKGTAPLSITAINVEGDGFSLVEPFEPQTLDAKQLVTVNVAFVPTRAGPSVGRLVISSTDPREAEKTVTLSAVYRSAESRQREIAQARAVLGNAKRDLNTAYALLTFESTNKSLMATRRQMGRDKFLEVWPTYERANEILTSIDPALADTEFYVDENMNLHKRSAE